MKLFLYQLEVCLIFRKAFWSFCLISATSKEGRVIMKATNLWHGFGFFCLFLRTGFGRVTFVFVLPSHFVSRILVESLRVPWSPKDFQLGSCSQDLLGVYKTSKGTVKAWLGNSTFCVPHSAIIGNRLENAHLQAFLWVSFVGICWVEYGIFNIVVTLRVLKKGRREPYFIFWKSRWINKYWALPLGSSRTELPLKSLASTISF